MRNKLWSWPMSDLDVWALNNKWGKKQVRHIFFLFNNLLWRNNGHCVLIIFFLSSCIPEVPKLHLVGPKYPSYSALLPEQISAAWNCSFPGFCFDVRPNKPWIHFIPSVNNSFGEPQDSQHSVHYLRWKMQISFQLCRGQQRGCFLYSGTLQEHLHFYSYRLIIRAPHISMKRRYISVQLTISPALSFILTPRSVAKRWNKSVNINILTRLFKTPQCQPCHTVYL